MSSFNKFVVPHGQPVHIGPLWSYDCAETRERERIAARMHDDFGQSLAVITLALDRWAADRGDAQACIADIRKALVRLDQSWRQAVFSPEPAQAPDMLPALANLCSAAEREMQLRCSLRVAADAAPPTGAAGRVLLRGVSELLLNVHKHAGCPHVDVRLDTQGPWVEVSVRDRGRKPLEPTAERRRGRGFGLMNLKRELRTVGGDMRIEAVDPGRKVRLRVPALQRRCGAEFGA